METHASTVAHRPSFYRVCRGLKGALAWPGESIGHDV